MIAIDTNVLVYALASRFPLHERARARLAELAEGDEPWGLPVFCLTELVRVVTHPKFPPPFSVAEVRAAVEAILASPTVRILSPGSRFPALFLDALEEADATGNLAFDAQIVAVCREHGVATLLTEDRDFARFRRFGTETLAAR